MTAAPIPTVFLDCVKEFRPDKDYKYAICVQNITSGDTPCELLTELHRAKDFRTYFLAIIPVVLSIIALILNAAYLVLQWIAYIKRSSSYRKRYIFLISRALSTIMALLLLYIVIIVWKQRGFIYSSAMIFIFIGSLDFLSITGTYVMLSVLLYTAVNKPILYKTRLMLRHCGIAVALIWIVAIAIGICVGLWGATLFYPNSAPVKCSFSGCQKPLSIVLLALLLLCYAMVLTVYAILFFRMHKRTAEARKRNFRTDSTASRQSSYIAMKRLGLNMGTFAIGNIPIVVVLAVAIGNLHKLAQLGEGDKSPCKTYLYSKLFVQVEILASIAAMIWIIGMILDPVINFMADPLLRSLGLKVWRVIIPKRQAKDELELESSTSERS